MNTNEMMEQTGATFRQLDHWARCGIIGPTGVGSGRYRQWDPDDVPAVAAMVRVSAALKGGGQGGREVLSAVRDAVRAGQRSVVLNGGQGVTLSW